MADESDIMQTARARQSIKTIDALPFHLIPLQANCFNQIE